MNGFFAPDDSELTPELILSLFIPQRRAGRDGHDKIKGVPLRQSAFARNAQHNNQRGAGENADRQKSESIQTNRQKTYFLLILTIVAATCDVLPACVEKRIEQSEHRIPNRI